MRLDKYISNASDYSRSQVKRLIKNGLVTVDGHVETDPSAHISETANVLLDQVPVNAPGHRYFMLHKPQGVVSATKDSEHPTAIDLMDEPRPEQLQIAGRLDIDATGLLLITDDGQWNHAVTSPKSHCKKTYQVRVAEPIDPSLVRKFNEGIWLDGEKRRCLPAALEILSEDTALVTISEGKYHQVKRMFVAMGNHVITLKRLKMGQIVLDPALSPGNYRPLTDIEIMSVTQRD